MKLRKKNTFKSASMVKNMTTAMLDSKIDKRRKLMVAGIILYIISPFDILPDILPMVGYADDIIVPILLFVAERLLSNNDRNNVIEEQKNQLSA